MAQGKIIVETAQLDAASAKVSGLADTYKSEYEKLYKLVEDLQASWAGAEWCTTSGTCNRLGKAVMRCSKISTFTKSTYNIQGYETGECYVETGRKSESN